MTSQGDTTNEHVQAVIVVVGGGGSGLAAAVTAAEKGSKVVVVEVLKNLGGNSAMAHGLFNIKDLSQEGTDNKTVHDEYFKKAMDYAYWRTNPRLVRTLIEKSGDIVAWLEKQGVKFEKENPFYPSMYRISGKGRGGPYVMKALAKRCAELNIDVLLNTRARKLLVEGGKLKGVVAEREDKQIQIHAGSVILATGGFAGNRELLKKYFPSVKDEDEIYLMGKPNQGDGLLMGTEIGADTDGSPLLEIASLIFPWSTHVSLTARNPRTIWVNKHGERFVDEAVGFPWFTNAIFRQPGKIFYALFDETIKQAFLKEELSPFDASTIPPGSWPSQVDKELQLQAEKGKVKISRSWDEIAQWMGTEPGVLKTTIDEYNASCEQGHDPIFAKDRERLLKLDTPPYYGCKCCVNLLVTHGDIRINHHMEILDRQGKPIAGLYAVGDDTGDVDAGTYNIIDLPGHSFGFAINSGRIAGENAVEFVNHTL